MELVPLDAGGVKVTVTVLSLAAVETIVGAEGSESTTAVRETVKVAVPEEFPSDAVRVKVSVVFESRALIATALGTKVRLPPVVTVSVP